MGDLKNIPITAGKPSTRAIKIIALIIISLITIAYTKSINPQYIFSSDGMVKLVQAKGLLQSNFSSEEIYYPAKLLDPDFRFSPIDTTDHAGTRIGPFPVAVAFVLALILKVAPAEIAVWLAVFLFIVCTAILLRFWCIRIESALFYLVCTAALSHYLMFLDIALGISLFLAGLTVLFQGRGLLSGIAAGVLLSLGTFFRNEVALAGFLLVSIYAAHSFFGKEKVIRTIQNIWKERVVWIILGYAFALGAFLLFNFLRYETAFGPRMAANPEILQAGWMGRIMNMKALYFYDSFRVGFFLYTPMFILLIGFGFYRFRSEKSVEIRIIFYATVSYLFIAGILAPNNSNIDWGTRYLAPAVPLLIILLDDIYKDFRTMNFSRKKSFLGFIAAILIVFSLGMNYVVWRGTKAISGQMKSFHMDFEKSETNLIIFGHLLLVSHLGHSYFSKRALLIRNASDVKLLPSLIRKGLKKGSHFSFYYGKAFWAKDKLDKKYDNTQEVALRLLNAKFVNIKKIRYKYFIEYVYEL